MAKKDNKKNKNDKVTLSQASIEKIESDREAAQKEAKTRQETERSREGGGRRFWQNPFGKLSTRYMPRAFNYGWQQRVNQNLDKKDQKKDFFNPRSTFRNITMGAFLSFGIGLGVAIGMFALPLVMAASTMLTVYAGAAGAGFFGLLGAYEVHSEGKKLKDEMAKGESKASQSVRDVLQDDHRNKIAEENVALKGKVQELESGLSRANKRIESLETKSKGANNNQFQDFVNNQQAQTSEIG